MYGRLVCYFLASQAVASYSELTSEQVGLLQNVHRYQLSTQGEMNDLETGAAGENEDRAYAEEDEDGVNAGAGHDAAATDDNGAADPSADNGAVVQFEHPEWLHTCQEIYLDAGANIGVQVRKFFEPEKYPNALMLPVFDAVFGQVRNSSNRKCALGIEPNSVHQARLRELEAVYARKGWNVHFYNFAVWKSEGVMQFNETDEPGNSDWGAALALAPVLLSTRRWHVNEVRTADLDAFIRQLPHDSVKLMKMDVEGAEYETLARMLQQGSLCRDTVGKITIEAHANGNVGTWQGPRTFEEIQTRLAGLDQTEVCKARGGPTEISNIDDESYLLDGIPWPE